MSEQNANNAQALQATQDLDTRSAEELEQALRLAQHTVYKRYLDQLEQYPIILPGEALMSEPVEKCVRAFQLKKLSIQKGEDTLQKLSTVYHAAMAQGSTLFLLLNSKRNGIDFYMGVRRGLDEGEAVANTKRSFSYNTLKDGIQSQFPGSDVLDASEDLKNLLDDILGEEIVEDGRKPKKGAKYITSVSCVASNRDKSKTQDKDFIQGIEHLIDSMQGSPFTAFLIAEPVTSQEQASIRNGYEQLYSTLSSFQKSTWSYNENKSHSVMHSLSEGITNSVTHSTSQTQSHTTSKSKSSSNSVNIGIGGNTSSGTTKTSPTVVSRIGSALGSIAGTVSGVTSTIGSIAMVIPGGQALGTGAFVATALLGGLGGVGSAMQGSSVAQSIGKSLGMNANFGHTWTTTTGTSDTTGSSQTDSTGESKNKTETDGTTDTNSLGRTLQIESQNKAIQELLARIEEQLKRTRMGEDYGLYNCCAYFLSKTKQENSILAADNYRALMIGENSSVECGAVNHWSDDSNPDAIVCIKEYLRRFSHPVFAMPLVQEPKNEEDLVLYTPATMVSGQELPLHLGLPMRSVVGLPVVKHAPFGRNVQTNANHAITLGNLYHMGQVNENVAVTLNKNSLASHTFITGSTGAGKSNTIYNLLDEICKDGSAADKTTFLVIEPAKGEYKHVFGNRADVYVYGTNPNKAPLLKINPFSFPEDIHVLEHIDRLVEIFNACWPMYAAMPAVLKDAIERCYQNAGWDLDCSNCEYEPKRYPTFVDLMNVLPTVVQESAYSADTQSDYIGALYTRVKSLTNGINGRILCATKELPNEELFDQNVIVDISRVGSQETKSLIMGIFVLKLQEYRMAGEAMNVDLQHVTVLEEAHNLLRRTSTEQAQEGANLQGKAVEMLTNAIAEMRTYGEGFMIADQAPGLLDEAVIRNTNTKIILRLPDAEDRKLVGHSAALNDQQIEELAKLSCGVAAVYQNDWLEPVLCKVNRFANSEPFQYQPTPQTGLSAAVAHYFAAQFNPKKELVLTPEDVDSLYAWADERNLSSDTIVLLRKGLHQALSREDLGTLCYNCFEGLRFCRKIEDLEQVDAQAAAQIEIPALKNMGDWLQTEIKRAILEASKENFGTEMPNLSQKIDCLIERGWLQ